MHSFRKRAPHHIALRDLSAAELAQVSLGLVHRAGYELHSADTCMFPGEEGELELMTLIVNQSYTPEQIKEATAQVKIAQQLAEDVIGMCAYIKAALPALWP